MQKVMAYANANIALVKYWGKADKNKNIPSVPSLSMTLDGLGTRSILSIDNEDILLINNRPKDKEAFLRYVSFLNQAREIYNFKDKIKTISNNNVPYQAGLASSASSYAALACGLNKLLSLNLDATECSKLARMGSASAARSIFSGFVALKDTHAYQIENKLSLSMLILLVSSEKKGISSRDAMDITSKTSPFFNKFKYESENDFNEAIKAIKEENFSLLGEVMEHSTLKMHALMWAAKPSINYLKPLSFKIIEAIYDLRKEYKDIAYFTADAGPNIKILVEDKNLLFVKNYLTNIFPDVKIISSKAGVGAYCE